MRTRIERVLPLAAAFLLLSLGAASAQSNEKEGRISGPGRTEAVLAGIVAVLSATLLLRRRSQFSG